MQQPRALLGAPVHGTAPRVGLPLLTFYNGRRRCYVRCAAHVPVTVSVRKEVRLGESLRVVGNGTDDLGNWKAEASKWRMKWGDDHVWTITAAVPVGARVKFKVWYPCGR